MILLGVLQQYFLHYGHFLLGQVDILEEGILGSLPGPLLF